MDYKDFNNDNKDLTIEELQEKFGGKTLSSRTINYYQNLIKTKREVEITDRITEVVNALKEGKIAFEKIEYDKQENCIKVYY